MSFSTKRWPANSEGDRAPTARLGVFFIAFGQEKLNTKADYFCGLLALQNIPATGNSFPAADHARDGNKQVFVNEESSTEGHAELNKL